MKNSLTSVWQQPLWLLILCFSLPLNAQQSEQQELAEVQQQIKATEQQLRQQKRQLQDAEKQLQQSDRKLATASGKVHTTEQELRGLQQREKELLQQQQELTRQLGEQQKLLANQLKSAYSLGQHDYSRLLLNQQDTAKLERVLSYYQYFNRARMKQLAEIEETASKLNLVAAELSNKQQQLSEALAELQQQQRQLLAAKQSQQESVDALQQLLKQQGAQLDYLRQNEQSLQTTINELQKMAARAKELSGLNAQKGSLDWPLYGRVMQRFGEARQGIPSRGILIQGSEGSVVKAIADGKVIYADWLKGYGWVIVLDHGEGFMSLYGHNQNLLKQPGQNIMAGETIALVGMSGGQSAAGLYFEIRNKGEAINPLPWLNRS